jgi:hypothetical protein
MQIILPILNRHECSNSPRFGTTFRVETHPSGSRIGLPFRSELRKPSSEASEKPERPDGGDPQQTRIWLGARDAGFPIECIDKGADAILTTIGVIVPSGELVGELNITWEVWKAIEATRTSQQHGRAALKDDIPTIARALRYRSHVPSVLRIGIEEY